MTQTISLTLTAEEAAGTQAAMEAYNDSLPATVPNPAAAETIPNPDHDPEDPESEATIANPDYDDEAPATIPNPDLCATIAAYMQFVLRPVWADYGWQRPERVAEILGA